MPKCAKPQIFEDLNINSTDIGYYSLAKDREMMSEVAELVINQPISSSCILAKQARSARKSILQKKRIGHEPPRVLFRDITSSINNQDHAFSSNITQVSSQLLDKTISKDARSSRKYILQHKRKGSTAHSGSSNLPTNLETNGIIIVTLCGMSSNDEIGSCSVDGGNIYSVDISEESHMNLNDVQTITLSNDEYLDLGDLIYNCEYCGAYMWYEERSEKSKNPLYPKFSHCCSKGKIQLPLLKEPPLLLRNLLNGVDPRSINYINNIRAYNMMFSFTSMGGKVDTSVNKGRVSRCESKSAGIRLDIVNDLKSMLDAYNPLAKSFRMARDRFRENDNLDMRMKFIGTREYNRRMCNLPTAPEVAALIVGDIDDQMDVRDIIIGNAPTTSIGKCFVIPTSFTGGPRYMIQNHQDAMAICKWYGFPDLFITITCNPKWPEISRYLASVNSNPEDRPDIICRVFKMKLDVLIKDLKDHLLLGKTQAGYIHG
ncbi:hypothetical protein OROMI_014407 [Orobanche minor]